MCRAGPGGTITLSFRPASTYHLALVVSMLAVAILLAVTAWSFSAWSSAWPRRGAGPEAGVSPAGYGRAWLGVLGVAALIFVAGGPVALAVPLLAFPAWLPLRPPRRATAKATAEDWLPRIAFAGLLASGLLSAVRPFGAGLLGPFGWPAQACALIALAAALTPAVAGPAATAAGEPNR